MLLPSAAVVSQSAGSGLPDIVGTVDDVSVVLGRGFPEMAAARRSGGVVVVGISVSWVDGVEVVPPVACAIQSNPPPPPKLGVSSSRAKFDRHGARESNKTNSTDLWFCCADAVL